MPNCSPVDCLPGKPARGREFEEGWEIERSKENLEMCRVSQENRDGLAVSVLEDSVSVFNRQ